MSEFPAAARAGWFFFLGDAAAAAAVRIAFGGCYLFMLWDVYPVLDLLLGHSGYFGTLDQRDIPAGLLNALYYYDSPINLRVWFCVAVSAAVCTLVGLFSRFAVSSAVLCLILMHRRNPYMLYGADMVLFNIGFWLIFVRSDRAWSLDEWYRRRRGRGRSRDIPLWPLRVIQIQIALIYLRTSLAKLGTEPWRDGSAVYYAIHAVGNDLFEGIMSYKLLLTVLTYGALGIELAFAFLVFWHRTRWIALILVVSLHIGIDLLMSIRFFSLVMYAGLTSFVLPVEWVKLEYYVRNFTLSTRFPDRR